MPVFVSVFIVAFSMLMPALPARAEQQIEWKQTLNLPKGLNLPKDAAVDILGIELGDSYADAKEKVLNLLGPLPPPKPEPRTRTELLQRYGRQAMGAEERPPFSEIQTRFSFSGPGGSVTANYVGEVAMRRTTKGASQGNIHETLGVVMSGPPSGQQVVGITRSLNYVDQADQPSIADLIARLQDRLKAPVQTIYTGSQSTTYRFQFNEGKGHMPPRANVAKCNLEYRAEQAEFAKNINSVKDCDVVLHIEIAFGVTNDHAKSIAFTLSDNERAKANALADFAFFENYVNNQTARPRGAGPPL